MLELRARLEVKIGRLPMAAASPREPHVKPPSHHLAEIEAVKRPTEAEVLTRCLMPLLQHTLSGDASQVLESSILDLCLEELFAVLRNRAPDLCALVHAVRVATGAALKRNDAAAGEEEASWPAPAPSAGMPAAAPSAGHPSAAPSAGRPKKHVGMPPAGAPAVGPDGVVTLSSVPEPFEWEELETNVAFRFASPPRTADTTKSSETKFLTGRRLSKDGEPPPAAAVDAYEDELLKQMQAEEHDAACVFQRRRRRVLMIRAMPGIKTRVLQMAREKMAATRMQSYARGWLIRTAKVRFFRDSCAARKLQRAERVRMRNRMRQSLLYNGGKGLTKESVEKCLFARDAFLLLEEFERIALVPTLLAMCKDPIESLQQAKDLWEDLTPIRRATAILNHCKKCNEAEKNQIIHLLLTQTIDASELMELLTFLRENVKRYWGVEQNEFVQAFLETQPNRIAQVAENKLLDTIVDALPVDAVARSMQRLALFSNLPPVRNKLPTTEKKFSRIPQYPNLPAKSHTNLEKGVETRVAGGVFGPVPGKKTVLLPASETHSPRNAAPAGAPQPALLPRSQPRELEKKIADSRVVGERHGASEAAGKVASAKLGPSVKQLLK